MGWRIPQPRIRRLRLAARVGHIGAVAEWLKAAHATPSATPLACADTVAKSVDMQLIGESPWERCSTDPRFSPAV
jgi:hypothetical protein